MTRREHHKRACSKCGHVSWTSVPLSKVYIDAACKRAAGLTGTGRRGEGHYSTLAIVQKQVITFGTCPCCGRDNQRLINGKCDDFYWYDDSHDVDADLSARGRSARGGVNDWVRRGRA